MEPSEWLINNKKMIDWSFEYSIRYAKRYGIPIFLENHAPNKESTLYLFQLIISNEQRPLFFNRIRSNWRQENYKERHAARTISLTLDNESFKKLKAMTGRGSMNKKIQQLIARSHCLEQALTAEHKAEIDNLKKNRKDRASKLDQNEIKSIKNNLMGIIESHLLELAIYKASKDRNDKEEIKKIAMDIYSQEIMMIEKKLDMKILMIGLNKSRKSKLSK